MADTVAYKTARRRLNDGTEDGLEVIARVPVAASGPVEVLDGSQWRPLKPGEAFRPQSARMPQPSSEWVA